MDYAKTNSEKIEDKRKEILDRPKQEDNSYLISGEQKYYEESEITISEGDYSKIFDGVNRASAIQIRKFQVLRREITGYHSQIQGLKFNINSLTFKLKELETLFITLCDERDNVVAANVLQQKTIIKQARLIKKLIKK